MEDRSRLIKISILISLCSLLGLLALFLYYQPQETTTTTKSSLIDPRTFFPVSSSSRASNVPIGSRGATPLAGETSQTPASNLASPSGFGLKQITSTPIAGAAITKIDGKNYPVFVERASGHLFQVDEEQNRVVRLTNTTRPAIYDTYWGSDSRGTRLIMRSLKDGKIVNYSAFIRPAASSSEEQPFGELVGQDLGSAIRQLAVSPKGSQLLTLAVDANGSKIETSGFDGEKKKVVWRSAAVEWLIGWPQANLVALQTKSSALAAGYLYLINLTTGDRAKIIDGQNGLTTLVSPDGKKVLFSRSDRESFSTYIYDWDKNKSFSLGFRSFAEKCVWSGDSKKVYCGAPNSLRAGLYPDIWYRGEVSFGDSLWQADAATGEARNLLNTQNQNGGQGLDLTNLFLGTGETKIYFSDKTTGNLWLYDLNAGEQ